MALLLAVLCLGVLDARIPRNEEIARAIESAIYQQCTPEQVVVVVKRSSRLSTSFERIDIDITGGTLDEINLSIQPPEHVEGDEQDGQSGQGREIRIRDLYLRCSRITVGELPIHEMSWQLRDVRIAAGAADLSTISISSIQWAKGHAALNQLGLSTFFQTRELPIEQPVVTITPGGCSLFGKTRRVVRVPVRVRGELAVESEAVLYLKDPRLDVSFVKLPPAVAGSLLKEIHPLVDLNDVLKFPAPLVIDSIRHGKGKLQFDASLVFPPPG